MNPCRFTSSTVSENDCATGAVPGSRSLALSLAIVPSLVLAGGLHAQTATESQTATDAPKPAADQADKDTVVLDPVNVHGDRVTTPQLTSPKFTAPLVDVPQTFSVVPQEVFNKQSATTLSDVLRNTPGITFLAGEGGNASSADGDSFFMRGFDASGSIFVDGVRNTSQVSRDVYNIEQVEIAKGPAGSDIGRTTPGGYVNLASKSPTLEAFQRGSVSYGFDETGNADGRSRATIDINQPGADAGVALRFNAMIQDGGVVGRETAEAQRFGVAPSLAFGLGTPTRVVLAFEHFEQHDLPEYGLPIAAWPGYTLDTPAAPAISQDTFYGLRTDHDDAISDRGTVKLEHDLSPDLKFSNTTTAGRTERETIYTTPGNSATAYVPATGLLTRSRQGNNRENENFANLTNLTSAFETGSLEHTLSTGVELLYENQRTFSRTSFNLPATPVATPDTTSAFADPVFSGATTDNTVKTLALYAFDTVKLSEAWQLTGGLRWEKYKAEYRGTAAGGAATTPIDDENDLLSWKGGVVYKPRANGSLYAAYGKSVRPAGTNFSASSSGTSTSADNVLLDPQEANNYEIGTKWEFFQRRLSANLAVFYTENTNVATTDTASPTTVLQVNDQIVKGVEFSVSGRITDNWLVYGGIAKMESEYSSPSYVATAGTDGAELQWTPEWSGNIWTTYRLPFGLTVGGGAQYMDSVSRQTTAAPSATMPEVPDYWLFNGLLEYAINDHVSIRFNVNNVFDKDYIASLNNNGGRYSPGPGRSYVISADFSF